MIWFVVGCGLLSFAVVSAAVLDSARRGLVTGVAYAFSIMAGLAGAVSVTWSAISHGWL